MSNETSHCPHVRRASPSLRACSKINESECTVEQALSFCFERQLCRRADALICRRCLRACSKINESECTVEQALSFCFERQLCRRADAPICRRCLSGRG